MNINELIKKCIKEAQEEHISETGTYMVLSNLTQIKNDIEIILSFKHHPNFPKLVTGEHAWAGDHVATSKDDIEEVANFVKNSCEGEEGDLRESSSAQQAAIAINMKKKGIKPKSESYGEIDESKNCPTDPAKWSASKAAAKRKFDVYPSAYANGWAAKNYKAKGGGWKKCK
jgi:hypothetical protein